MSHTTSRNWLSSTLAVCFRPITTFHGRSGTALLLSLGVMFVSALVYLGKAESPWGKVVQKRLAKGQPLQFHEMVISSLWWAVLATALILLFLILTYRHWLPSKNSKTPLPKSLKMTVQPWWWQVGLMLSLGWCFWQSAPRLSHSLWNDEEYAMRRFAHGEWKARTDGNLEFEPASWKETLFYNRNSNNHLLDSTLTRMSLELWRGLTGAPRSEFNETVVRLPSLLAGLGSLLLVAMLGVRLGSPILGITSAWLLCFIPWHVHYTSDGKGYAELMFFILLHSYALLNALETNRIRWWLCFGFSEAAYLLCFPAAVYVALVTNLMVFFEQWRKGNDAVIPPLIAFNLIGAIPVIIWAAPSIPQVMKYFSEGNTMNVSMNRDWVVDLLSSLYLGFGEHNLYPDHHHGTSWKDFSTQTHWLIHRGFAVFLIIPLILLGLFRSMMGKNTGTRIVIAAPLLAAALSFTINSLNQSPMVVWHFVFILPGLAMCTCVALLYLLRWKTSFQLVFLFLFIATYAWSVNDATQRKRHFDRQPIRQTTDWLKQKPSDALIATWGVSDQQSRSYLPTAFIIKKIDELTELEQRARNAQLPLYVFFCGEQTATTTRNPDLTHHVRTSGQYRLVAEFPGLEELFSYRIFEWVAHSASPSLQTSPLDENQADASCPSEGN